MAQALPSFVISQTCSHFIFNLGCRSNPHSCFIMAKAMAIASAKSKSRGNTNANSKNSSSSRQEGKAEGKAKGGRQKGKATGKGRRSPGPTLGEAQLVFHDAVERRAAAADNSCAATPASRRSSSCAATPAGERPPGGHWLHAVGGDKAQLLKQSRSWLMMTCTEPGLNVLTWTKADLAEVLSLQFCEGKSPSESAMRLAGPRSFACSI